MYKISLESLRELFQLDHAVSIFTFDKTNYLIRILTNYPNRPANFYITWFTCFLCDKNYQNNREEQQNFHQLVKNWLDCLQNDFNILLHIIGKLDSLLDQLHNTLIDERTDQRMDIFQEYLLHICFEPSKSFRLFSKLIFMILHSRFYFSYPRGYLQQSNKQAISSSLSKKIYFHSTRTKS